MTRNLSGVVLGLDHLQLLKELNQHSDRKSDYRNMRTGEDLFHYRAAFFCVIW